MKLRKVGTDKVFEVIDREGASRRNPLGRVRLSDGHWRSGVQIQAFFEEVADADDSGVDNAGHSGDTRGADGGSESGLHSDSADSDSPGEDGEGKAGPEGDSGDEDNGDEDSVLEDA